MGGGRWEVCGRGVIMVQSPNGAVPGTTDSRESHRLVFSEVKESSIQTIHNTLTLTPFTIISHPESPRFTLEPADVDVVREYNGE